MSKVIDATNSNRRMTLSLAEASRRRRRACRDQVELDESVCAAAGRNDFGGCLRLEDRLLISLNPGERRLIKADERRIAKAVRLASQIRWIPPLLITDAGDIIGDPMSFDVASVMEAAEVTCVVVSGDVSDAEVKLITTALAHQAATGEIDMTVLRRHLLEIRESSLSLELTGIELPQIDLLIGSRLTDPALDKTPEPATITVSKQGDLWLLGNHRLLCADATDPDSYARLMDGKLAAASVGDPPFNVPIAGNVSGNGKVKHQDFVMGVGEWSEEEFQDFLKRYLTTSSAHVAPGGGMFAFMDWRSLHLLVLAGKQSGLTHVNTCIWSKGGGAMGSPWRSAHEMIAVFANGARLSLDNVQLGKHGKNRTNVWEYPGANRPGSSAGKALALHSTPKSVEMIADAILDVTRPGDIVLDPFLGSGTTIIAADAVDRIGYGLELDPKYVDVIIRRWEQTSGKAAIHAETGFTLKALAASRIATESST